MLYRLELIIRLTNRVSFAQADRYFFTLLKKEFTWTEVRQWNKLARSLLIATVPQVTDDANRGTYTRDRISVLRLFRK